ncbi:MULTISPECIES: hypothetical protein [unclassified Streptomyces]|uniref:hypothetical protein n=1 Tax=unclassified Streptomyces TaxID=2593676 RepID=UPI0006F97528|nr:MULTISPECIES: hypothetical protein [unclassified Streptomyces]KQX47300.1 hypothetical protein ASD33_21035 [Streptomyces sp. Root1304]KRA94607.1 hypothetical protein ASE09_30250 [Streptomyces sp. Root66D1]
MGPRGAPIAAAGVLCALGLSLALAGCGGEGGGDGGLKSAGATPAAVGPARLWPDLPPATNPPIDYGESDTGRVPGVEVPGGDVHAVDAVAVVRAEERARTDASAGSDALDGRTARALEACDSAPAACPVLRPYYRDLTGNGRDELIVGIRMPDQQFGVRVYLAEDGGLTRIMSTVDQVVSVEVAGRDLIMRSGSAGIPGYEYRTAWTWDEQQRSMLPTRDEIVRVKPPGTGPSTVPAPRLVSPVPSPASPPGPAPVAPPVIAPAGPRP